MPIEIRAPLPLSQTFILSQLASLDLSPAVADPGLGPGGPAPLPPPPIFF